MRTTAIILLLLYPAISIFAMQTTPTDNQSSIIETAPQSNTQTLSLSDYLTKLMDQDPEYKKIFSDNKIIDGQYQTIEGQFDPQANLSFTKTAMDAMTQGTATLTDVNSNAIDLNVSKMFLSSGTMLKAGYTYDASAMSISTPAPITINTYKPSIYLTLSQPLWQNAFGALLKFPFLSLELRQKMTKLQTKENLEKYYEKQIKAYYDWVKTTLALKITIVHYKNSQTLHNLIEKQYQSDYVNKTDFLRSQENLLKTEEALTNQLLAWNILTEQLCRKTQLPCQVATDWNNLFLEPTKYELQLESITKNGNRIRELFNLRFDALALEKQKLQETIKPIINGFATIKRYDSTASEGDLIGALDKNDLIIGVQSTILIGDTSYKGAIKENSEKHHQLSLEWQQTERDLLLISQQLDRRYLQTLKSQEQLQNIVNLTEERLVLETKRYNLGKLPLNQVTTTQYELVSNKNQLLNNSITRYTLYIAQLGFYDQLNGYVGSLVE